MQILILGASGAGLLAMESRPRPQCATPAVLSAWLNERAAHRLAAARTRPVARETACRSDVRLPPVCVHGTEAGQSALVSAVLELALSAYDVEIREMGFRAPLEDDARGGGPEVDIYLQDANGGAFTVPESTTASDSTTQNDASGYIVIDPDIDPTVLPAFVAHELHHVVQFAYDVSEHPTAYEGGAIFVEDAVFPRVNDYPTFVAKFQEHPHLALDWHTSLSSADGFYPYGAAIFFKYLSERFDRGGTTLIRDMWAGLSQAGASNEPDFYDALDGLLAGRRSSLDVAVSDFSLWRVFTGARSSEDHFDDGALWMEPTFAVDLTTADLPVINGGSPVSPMQYGTTFLRVAVENPEDEMDLIVTLSGNPESRWSLGAVARAPEGRSCIARSDSDPAGVARVRIAQMAQWDEIILGATNVGAEGRDPDEADYSSDHFSYSLTSEAPGVGAEEAAPCLSHADAPPTGWACRTTGARWRLNGRSLYGAVLPLFWWWRRRKFLP